MPKQYGDYEESVNSGLKAEDRFVELFVKNFPNTKVRTSTLYENKNMHIDVICTRGNTTVTFDVKEQKKLHRYDDRPSDIYTWVELQNNNGNKGWVYGEEKYIAFEKGDEFIIVERNKLLNLILDKKQEPIVFENRILKPYMQYQRKKYDNLDISVLTPYDDLYKIAHKVIRNG